MLSDVPVLFIYLISFWAFVVYIPKCSTFHNITCWHRSTIDGEIFPTRSKAVLCFSGGKSCGQIWITPQAFGSALLRLEIPTNHVSTHKQDEKQKTTVWEVYEVSPTTNCFECVLHFMISYIAYLVLYNIKNTHRNTLETKLIMFFTLSWITEVSRLGIPAGFDIIWLLLPKLTSLFHDN